MDQRRARRSCGRGARGGPGVGRGGRLGFAAAAAADVERGGHGDPPDELLQAQHLALQLSHALLQPRALLVVVRGGSLGRGPGRGLAGLEAVGGAPRASCAALRPAAPAAVPSTTALRDGAPLAQRRDGVVAGVCPADAAAVATAAAAVPLPLRIAPLMAAAAALALRLGPLGPGKAKPLAAFLPVFATLGGMMLERNICETGRGGRRQRG